MKFSKLFLAGACLVMSCAEDQPSAPNEPDAPDASVSEDPLPDASGEEDPRTSERQNALQIKANLVVSTPEELLEIVDRAKAKGAETLVFGDTKLSSIGLGESPGSLWEERMTAFVQGVKERELELVFSTISLGFCGAPIASAPDLTTGYPINGQPLRAQGDRLVPVRTATIANGGFEEFSGDRPTGWGFQDAVGERTFVDTSTAHRGNASFRADASGGELARISTSFDVEPFHQYTLKFWIKTDRLTASNLSMIVRDDDDRTRNLTNQLLSTPREGGGRSYFNRPNDLTLEWTEMRLAFNSLEANRVNIFLGLFGGVEGSVWWDDVTIEDTPALNWLVRDDLPQAALDANGGVLQFGPDIEPIVDEELGRSRFPGAYDTYHEAPAIRIGSSGSIDEGDVVSLSGYHGMVTQQGQTACAWNSEEMFGRIRRIHETLQRLYQPTGYLLNYSEIRTGGWEPSDIRYETSGAALAASLARTYREIEAVAPDAKHYFWSDMIDPFHNARENYYQVNNTIEGSWEGVDAEKVVLLTWWEGQKISDIGPDSLRFFADLGFEQVLGAFYDADVSDNYERWQTAAEGVDGILGGLYATWTTPPDYSRIEEFGDLWWSDD